MNVKWNTQDEAADGFPVLAMWDWLLNSRPLRVLIAQIMVIAVVKGLLSQGQPVLLQN